MTMLSDFFIATPSEVEGLDLNMSPGLDLPSMLGSGLDVRHLRGLCAACSAQETGKGQHLALLPNEECAAVGFPCILKLPEAAVHVLSIGDPEVHAAIARTWAESSGLEAEDIPLSEFESLVQELVLMARDATLTGKNLYVWLCEMP